MLAADRVVEDAWRFEALATKSCSARDSLRPTGAMLLTAD